MTSTIIKCFGAQIVVVDDHDFSLIYKAIIFSAEQMILDDERAEK